MHLKLNDQAQRTVLCKDPFRSGRRPGREAHRLDVSDYLVEPEVAGGFGDSAHIDTSTNPITVSRLHYAIDGWRGSHLLETFPVWVASDELVATVSAAGLTGFEVAEAQVDLSEQGRDTLRDRPLPHFVWFKPTGTRGREDFAFSSDGLVISERCLRVIRPLLGDDVLIAELDAEQQPDDVTGR